jgi:hypothetical protein
MDGWIDGWMDGWMDGWVDGRVVVTIEGWMVLTKFCVEGSALMMMGLRTFQVWTLYT